MQSEWPQAWPAGRDELDWRWVKQHRISRRALCEGLAVGATLGLLPRRGSGAPPPPKPAKDAQRVLLLGDSMIAGAFGIFLERTLLEGHGLYVRRKGMTSSGLSRPDFYDWMKEGPRACERSSPDVVVVMFGGNDAQGLWMGKKAPSPWIRWQEAAWTHEYRRRVSSFIDSVQGEERAVEWVGMPVMGNDRLYERMIHINRIYRGELAIRRRAHFIDTWPLLSGPRGEFRAKLEIDGERVRMRSHDGVHLTPAGANRMVEHVVPHILRALASGNPG